MKQPFNHSPFQLFGTASIGEKGQIVIPAEARKKLELKAGDKMIVLGGPHGSLMLMQPQQVTEIAMHMTAHMNQMFEAVKQAENEEDDQ